MADNKLVAVATIVRHLDRDASDVVLAAADANEIATLDLRTQAILDMLPSISNVHMREDLARRFVHGEMDKTETQLVHDWSQVMRSALRAALITAWAMKVNADRKFESIPGMVDPVSEDEDPRISMARSIAVPSRSAPTHNSPPSKRHETESISSTKRFGSSFAASTTPSGESHDPKTGAPSKDLAIDLSSDIEDD
ncbi:uncharacterized protein RCC_07610 [Ramularia collo-cygni]|uniref:Uncharacterized protein n=1 Tax=Ramularia collo-cygni TaxID=112498 RepID=A0A2D3V4Y1_9PEZI|nr:uncharacterized protein RCC_07610 [Ramularia collo-cygni]CZT21745.1 uncharacterized protein RCC_07610 [Ramularia collo-cygni]